MEKVYFISGFNGDSNTVELEYPIIDDLKKKGIDIDKLYYYAYYESPNVKIMLRNLFKEIITKYYDNGCEPINIIGWSLGGCITVELLKLIEEENAKLPEKDKIKVGKIILFSPAWFQMDPKNYIGQMLGKNFFENEDVMKINKSADGGGAKYLIKNPLVLYYLNRLANYARSEKQKAPIWTLKGKGLEVLDNYDVTLIMPENDAYVRPKKTIKEAIKYVRYINTREVSNDGAIKKIGRYGHLSPVAGLAEKVYKMFRPREYSDLAWDLCSLYYTGKPAINEKQELEYYLTGSLAVQTLPCAETIEDMYFDENGRLISIENKRKIDEQTRALLKRVSRKVKDTDYVVVKSEPNKKYVIDNLDSINNIEDLSTIGKKLIHKSDPQSQHVGYNLCRITYGNREIIIPSPIDMLAFKLRQCIKRQEKISELKSELDILNNNDESKPQIAKKEGIIRKHKIEYNKQIKDFISLFPGVLRLYPLDIITKRVKEILESEEQINKESVGMVRKSIEEIIEDMPSKLRLIDEKNYEEQNYDYQDYQLMIEMLSHIKSENVK